MKATVEVKNRQEANAVKRAMTDPVTRAWSDGKSSSVPATMMKARRRVLSYVKDRLDEQAQTPDVPPTA